ncbi:MAG TPA: hypothetical protein ENL06_01505 [Candidatus Portnoybacteria bacterium]|nr:hypothetical protein [Candidatus Portnoybacteria bacterium]
MDVTYKKTKDANKVVKTTTETIYLYPLKKELKEIEEELKKLEKEPDEILAANDEKLFRIDKLLERKEEINKILE